jgi:hypothetical protein
MYTEGEGWASGGFSYSEVGGLPGRGEDEEMCDAKRSSDFDEIFEGVSSCFFEVCGSVGGHHGAEVFL